MVKNFIKKGASLLIALSMVIPAIPVFAEDVGANSDVCVNGGRHNLYHVEGKKPTYTENGWEPYDYCANIWQGCSYTTFKPIPALGEPQINSYEEFANNLYMLEGFANMYAIEHPGVDPLELMIKYIRTGVERYNSGSWGIMAGYEDAGFANFVRAYENQLNESIDNLDEYLKFTALKNINDFNLPNGDKVDFGHMFGTMDISYTNKGSQNHADVGGWAGDLVDLISSADADEVSGTVEEMIDILKEGYFLKNPQESDVFSESDFYGDLDAYYILNTVLDRGYSFDFETGTGTLTSVIMEYFTEGLSVKDRAEYLLKTRLGNVGTKEQVRRAVYNAYTGNKMITTLEATRTFLTSQENINNLRKAACYTFADYICSLAGDYIEIESNPYYSEFNTIYSSLAPGVTYEKHYSTTADGKQIVYYVTTADLSNPNVTVYANYNENDPGKGWAMSRVLDQANAAQDKYGNPESDKYIKNYQVVAAVNADGYNMTNGEPGGLLVMDGKEWHGINASGFFGITKEGEAVIGTTKEYDTIYKEKLRDAVGAFGVTLVKDGKIAVSHTPTYYEDRASRTAVGITKTGKVVLMVLDGRQEPVSCGGSMQEIAQIMLEAGCYNAVNLDGGGSTTFVSKPEGKTDLELTSSPSDGYARSVSTSLMIVSTAPSSTKFDHARLDSEYSYATVGTPIKITPVGLSATGNVVPLPENCTWKIATNADAATITDAGIFTGTANNTFDIQLLCDGAAIGEKTINVVTPGSVDFKRKAIEVVYGSDVEIPINATYEGNAVAFNENDIVMSINPQTAGTFDGYRFHAAEDMLVESAVITAKLKNNLAITSNLPVKFYKQGENTFDFAKATGGDRQLAWDRQVSNALSDDAITYFAEDTDENMITSYLFAIDMEEIPIPSKLSDLTFMLPGADDADASAWNFLLQLAERVSVLTEVKPVLKFDERFDIDCSEMKVINEYFRLENVELNEELNELTLTLKWIDQTKSIDAETANPLCMLKGIKLTPKDGVWEENDKLNAIHVGKVGYTIYLRANALYTFATDLGNQDMYNLYPFKNTFIDANGEEKDESGAYFADTYKTFEDRYTLSMSKKNGWINEDGGFAYYIDGERLTGVQLADGLYYNFGDDGINVGQQTYTGLFESGGKTYYAKLGKLIQSDWQLVGGDMYHCHADGVAYITTQVKNYTCVRGGYVRYTCSNCKSGENSGYIFPQGHEWDANYVCRICKTAGKNIEDITINFNTLENPWTGGTPAYNYKQGGVHPLFYATEDGKTTLTWARGAIPNDDGTMRDLDVSYSNPTGIGYSIMKFTGTGNYYGERELKYYIKLPKVQDIKADVTTNSITLSWKNIYAKTDKFLVYDYTDGTRRLLGETTGKSFKVENLLPNRDYKFSINASATTTDGEAKTITSGYADYSATTASLPEVIHNLSDISIAGTDFDVKLIKEDDINYIMLPSHSDISSLAINFTADSLLNEITGEISGDKGKVDFIAKTGENTFQIDLSQLTTLSDNCYNINIKIGDYKQTQIKIMCGAGIPSMFINSSEVDKDREFVDSVKGNEATGNMTLINASGNKIYDGGLTQIKARGNSTFTYYDKKAYQIKLSDKSDLLGNGEKVKTWVLLANYADATLMHDKLFKDMAKQMDFDYVASTDWVNLWYDGEYRGVYLITEKNSVGKTSVDITDLEKAYEDINPGYGEIVTTEIAYNDYNCEYKYTTGLTDPENITGGYLIELNKTEYDEINGFKTKRGKGVNIKSPEWLSKNAVKYISEYYQEFEDAVYAKDIDGKYTGYNQATGKYFYEYVDIDSLVKMVVLHGIGANPDGFISSVYFNKDADSIMHIGPIWDQDITLGTGWSIENPYNTDVYTNRYLVEALMGIPVFKQKFADFFENTAEGIITETYKEGGTIDNHYDALYKNAEMNYKLWPYVKVGYPKAEGHIWDNANYELVVSDMKTWLEKRLGYLKEKYIPEYNLGDANCDGKINSDDAVLILKYVVGYTDDNFNINYADINNDGKVNSDDAVEILKYVVSY